MATEPTSGTSFPAPLRVVGIGASAGGLESLEQFFSHMPADSGMAFVVLQHLSPDFRSMMDELLSRRSSMPVRLAEHEEQVQPNRVYLLPPRKEMTIQGGRLRLTDKEPSHALSLPIDLFFRSLAKDVGPNAVAIVMSGSGSDGSRGVREVKKAGGLVLVESPEIASFDGMPSSAMATGVVDQAAPASQLPLFLDREPGASVRELREEGEPISGTQGAVRLLLDQFGLDLSLYKMTTVNRRILRRAEMRGKGVDAYVESLRSDPEELSALYHDMLIGVTRFFRDPDAFAFLETEVIPEILGRVGGNEEIRVWVAGCATGEEPYSLAMLFFEQLTAAERPLNLKILATDLHRDSLAHASAGLYGEEQLEHVSRARRERFFTRKPTGYQISQDLRQLIVFAPHNVTKDAPFTRMHLVSCRNLLIYLDPDAQKTVLALFHFGLATGGTLFLGASESPGPLAQEFTTCDEHWKVYRKRREIKLLEPLRIGRKNVSPTVLPTPARSHAADAHLLSTYDQLLDRYMPPSFLVSENLQLVDTFGGADRLFRLGRRRPSTGILDLLEGDLRTIVASAVQRAFKKEGGIRYTGVAFPGDGDKQQRSTLTAEAMTNSRTGATLALVTVERDPDPAASGDRPAGENASARAMSQERMDTLEGELSYTRETLQLTIEELQTSNEELQATNEELVASNEELQSTNEELHSVNEELYTVNAEYQKKILELRELNADMQHFLEGTDIGTLFLDRELRIRKYTPGIATVFHIQPQDLGRSLRDFSHSLKRPSLMDEVERALREGGVVEDEVRDAKNTPFFLRILPHQPTGRDGDAAARGSQPGSPVGVVLSLTDISALDHARARLAQLSAIVESSEDAIIGKTLDGTITSWNRGAERLYGYTAKEAVDRNVRMLASPELEPQIAGFLQSLRRGERVEHAETMRVRKDGTQLDVSVTISPVYDGDGKVSGASAIARDVSVLRRAQRELEERQERIRLLLESTAEAIFGLDTDGACTFANAACARILGFDSQAQLVGRSIHALIHPSLPDGTACREDRCPLYTPLRTGAGAHSDEHRFTRADGTPFPAEYWSHPVQRDGRTVGAVVTFLDITDRKGAESEIRTASRRREQFLAMLSHELRNPLAAVLNATKVMALARDTPHVELARGVIERQATHMARLLDDLLDVSRISRGDIELRKEDVDLRHAVRAATEALQPLLQERQADVVFHSDGRPLPVHGDPARLQQIVGNLISNAARYSPPGTRIVVSAGIERGEVTLRVKDDGYGIPPHMLSEIFELFVQADQGLDRSRGGLGVGLTLVKTIAELHGGSVEARSDGPDTGSEFLVRLPLGRMDRADGAAESMPGRSRRRVVIVEDQDDSREMMRILLQAKGHSVVEVTTGEAAFEAIARERPDVALVDIGLPVVNGYEVARRVRADPALAKVRLIALTGYGSFEDVEASRAAGFDDHLTKPATPDRVEKLLAGDAQR